MLPWDLLSMKVIILRGLVFNYAEFVGGSL